ncbi:hypothetical protein LTR02_012073 [Friedmanniomyces endolithicus]|nr:hypothetical protein LTR02_012073 [Friedmanniomyces endolithicus]
MAFIQQAARPHPKDVAANSKIRLLQDMHAYSNTPLATFHQPFGPQPYSDDNQIYRPSATLLHISQDTGGLPSSSDREQYRATIAPDSSSSSSSAWKRSTDPAPICTIRAPGKLGSTNSKKTFHAPSISRPEKSSEVAPELFTLETRLMSLHETFHGVPPPGSSSDSPGGFFEISRDYRKDEEADGSESTIRFSNAVDGSTYEALVAANVDLSLISAICICLEGLKYGKV